MSNVHPQTPISRLEGFCSRVLVPWQRNVCWQHRWGPSKNGTFIWWIHIWIHAGMQWNPWVMSLTVLVPERLSQMKKMLILILILGKESSLSHQAAIGWDVKWRCFARHFFWVLPNVFFFGPWQWYISYLNRPFGLNFLHVSICLSRKSTFWTCWSLLAWSLEWKNLIVGFFVSITTQFRSGYCWQDSQLQDDIMEGQGDLTTLRLDLWTTRNWWYLLMSFKIII